MTWRWFRRMMRIDCATEERRAWHVLKKSQAMRKRNEWSSLISRKLSMRSVNMNSVHWPLHVWRLNISRLIQCGWNCCDTWDFTSNLTRRLEIRSWFNVHYLNLIITSAWVKCGDPFASKSSPWGKLYMNNHDSIIMIISTTRGHCQCQHQYLKMLINASKSFSQNRFTINGVDLFQFSPAWKHYASQCS